MTRPRIDTATLEQRRADAALLADIGRALYGDTWAVALAKDIGMSYKQLDRVLHPDRPDGTSLGARRRATFRRLYDMLGERVAECVRVRIEMQKILLESNDP
jgi:hypothetical protein